MRRTLRDLFLALLTRAPIEGRSFVRPETLLEEAIYLAALPTHALGLEGPKNVLLAATTLAPERDFRALFAAGYTGPSTRALSECDESPLLALCGSAPKTTR